MVVKNIQKQLTFVHLNKKTVVLLLNFTSEDSCACEVFFFFLIYYKIVFHIHLKKTMDILT